MLLDEWRDTTAAVPFANLFLSYFGVFGCQENSSFYLFSKLFSMDFLEKKKRVDYSYSFISQFQNYWVWEKPIFLLVLIQEEAEIELGVDSKCVLKEEGDKLKVKGASQVV